MIKIFKKIPILLLLLIISCASTGERIKQSNPDMYKNIVGTWYILSQNKPYEILYTITFNDNGTISGDTAVIFGFADVHWDLTEDEYSYGYLTKEGHIIVYEGFMGRTSTSDQIHFITDKTYIPSDKINSIYLDSIPPLNIMVIESQKAGVENKIFMFSSDLTIVNNLKAKFSDHLLIDKEKWENLNKNSISEHIEFIKSVTDLKFKSAAETSLYGLLDTKIIKYMQKEFKSYSKYSNNMIVYEDGTEMCKFYEFLKTPVLFKNKISGEKYIISIVKNNSIKNGFDVVCQVNGKELNISFKPNKDKLVLVGLSSGYQVNPKNWEVAVSTLAMAWNEYPEDLENIDVDLLEKL